MADNTIAKAYVQIIPTTKGIKNTLSSKLGSSADGAGILAGKSFGKKMLGAISALGIGAAIGSVIKESLSEGAALEQSFGGLETIYGEAANAAKAYAAEAVKAGISANSYAEQAVSFGASLKQAFGGDVQKAAEAANTAIMDMTDNAAKMGTPIENIQNAYQGFAKQNYTMLDNLKLGYGGTKTEMERLLADAQKLSGVEYNIDNLGDVYDAIHVIQEDLGLTGVAAEEAKTTLQGSLGAMKASFQNVLGNMALGEDIAPSLDELANTVTTFITGNLIPMASNVISALPQALTTILIELAPTLIPAGLEMVTSLIGGLAEQTPSLMTAIVELIPMMVTQLIDNLPVLLKGALDLFMAIIQAIPIIVPKIIGALPQIINSILGAVGKMGPELFRTAGTALLEIVKAIPTILSSALSAIANVGLNLVKGLWNGISNAVGWVLDKISGFGQQILGGIKSIFGIHSPSKETAWMGDMLMQGLANGIDDNAQKAASAMKSAANRALGAVDVDSLNSNLSMSVSASGTVGGTAESSDIIIAIIAAIKELGDRIERMSVVLDSGKTIGWVDAELNDRGRLADRGVV